jgi:hypothetical protein
MRCFSFVRYRGAVSDLAAFTDVFDAANGPILLFELLSLALTSLVYPPNSAKSSIGFGIRPIHFDPLHTSSSQ